MEQLIGTLTISVCITVPDLHLPVMGKGKSKDVIVYRNVTEKECSDICKQFQIDNPYPIYEAVFKPASTIIPMY